MPNIDFRKLPGTEVLEITGDTVNPNKKVNAEDFQIMKVIGKGGYGTVNFIGRFNFCSRFFWFKRLLKVMIWGIFMQ